jgi:predicted secreted hydrolase
LGGNQGTNALVVRWHLVIPSAGLELEVQPQLPDAELDATRSTGTVYWEGPVRVSGATNGEGYAELTGHATSLARRF